MGSIDCITKLLILAYSISYICFTNSINVSKIKQPIITKQYTSNQIIRTLLIDNYDSYTYNIWQALAQVNGIEPIVIYNNAFNSDWDQALAALPHFDNIVISPGPGNPTIRNDFGICLDAILRAEVPLLGICLGHQGLAYAYGGKVKRSALPMHGRLSKLVHNQQNLFRNIESQADVVRYHSLIVDEPLPMDLEATAWTNDGIIMAMQHKFKPQYGVQFHPESIKTTSGHKIFQNFRDLTYEYLRNSPSPSLLTVSRNELKPSNIFSTNKKIPMQYSNAQNNSINYFHIIQIDPMHNNFIIQNIYQELFEGHPCSFWLDSEHPNNQSLDENSKFQQLSFFGALDTMECFSYEYGHEKKVYKRYGLFDKIYQGTFHEFPHRLIRRGSNDTVSTNQTIFDILRQHLQLETDEIKQIQLEELIQPADGSDKEAFNPLHRRDVSMLPFDITTKWFGYLGYELRHDLRDILLSDNHLQSTPNHYSNENKSTPKTSNEFPMSVFLIPTRYIVYDHKQNKFYVISNGKVTNNLQPSKQSIDHTIGLGRDLALKLSNILRSSTNKSSVRTDPVTSNSQRGVLTARKSKESYKSDISKCLDYINEGETYEVCLTVPFQGPLAGISEGKSTSVAALEVYNQLRNKNPAPYACFLSYDPVSWQGKEENRKCKGLDWYRDGGFAICSTSPECYLRKVKNRIISKPIKGTIRRNLTDPIVDQAVASRLQHDEKSQAENLLIVDLVRNDIGRVCATGSVHVPHLMKIETFASVHQMVSTVEGVLRPDQDAVDAIMATFPGGSMTGAPKLRTMKIIEELEGYPRGIYSGSIGYIGMNGDMDLNIVIRTAIIANNTITIGSGGAIVAMSNPDEEVEEVLLKVSSVAKALGYTVQFDS